MVSIWGQHLFSSFFGIKFLYSLRQIKSRCLSASPIWSCNADYLVCLNKDSAHTHCTMLVAALKHLRNQYYVIVAFLLLSNDLPHRCSGTMLFPLWLNISLRTKRLSTLCGFHYLIEQGVNRNEGTSFFSGRLERSSTFCMKFPVTLHTNWLRPASLKWRQRQWWAKILP